MLHKALLRAVRDYACLALELYGETPPFAIAATAKQVFFFERLATFQARISTLDLHVPFKTSHSQNCA